VPQLGCTGKGRVALLVKCFGTSQQPLIMSTKFKGLIQIPPDGKNCRVSMKISFCTTCMNRLHHLVNTLPSNLQVASSINSEIVLLDYGSTDGLAEWVWNSWGQLQSFVQSGRFRFIRTDEPKYFWAAHAKNVTHRAATGDILCNLDADNYLVPGYPEFLYNSFSEDRKIIVPSSPKDPDGNNGTCGKIAVTKESFYSVNGYDESQDQGWGWDDTNFQFRARMHNNLRIVPCSICFNKVISHSNDERVANYRNKNIIETEDMSVANLKLIDEQKRYVANVGKDWGQANLVENFSY